MTIFLDVRVVFLRARLAQGKFKEVLAINAPYRAVAHVMLKQQRVRTPEEDTMIQRAKLPFDHQVSFHTPSMRLQIPLDASSTINTATDKLLSEFEDHRVHGEKTGRPRVDWLLVTFWSSYAAGIGSIAIWALA
jgi:hypothetical protein